MIISKTPYRISFFGGGTDYPEWFQQNGGTVISTTIDKYCYISCRELPSFFTHKHRIVYSKIELCDYIENIEHPAVKAILQFVNMDLGLEIHHHGELPNGSGIGTSSSFVVGLLNAIYALTGNSINKRELAEKSIYIERTLLKECGGNQDQISVAYGGFNQIVFCKNGDFQIIPINIGDTKQKDLESRLLLFYTGKNRKSYVIADNFVSNMNFNKKKLTQLHQIAEIAKNVLLKENNINEFGECLHESWMLKRECSKMISTTEIDDIYTKAINCGAIGGKILGAGGAGFLLIFAESENHKQIKDAVSLTHVPFSFSNAGSEIIFSDK